MTGVKDPRALKIVVGVNDDRDDFVRPDVVTTASCTTNCLAPAVKVIHKGVGILRGSITTLRDLTNTQTIVDAPHKDLRSAVVDSLSTRVTVQTQVEVLAWYDDEWGDANRMVELAAILASSLTPA